MIRLTATITSAAMLLFFVAALVRRDDFRQQ